MRWQYRTTVLVLCLLAFFVTYFARMAISPVIPFIVEDFDVSNTQIGFALSGMWLAYGLSQFPSGVLGDRYGEKPVILLAVGGTAIASLLLAFAPVFPVFVLFAVLLGLVAGLHYAVATTLLSRTYDELGRAVGIHSIGGPLAGLVAPVAAAWVGVRFGWRPAVALALAVGLPVFAVFAWRVRQTEPRRPDQPMRERFEPGALLELVSRPAVAFTLVIAMLGTFIVQGLLTFLPTFLIEYHRYSATVASAAFSAFFVVRAVGQFLLGELSDRYGRDLAIGTAMLAGTVGLFGLVAGSERVAIGVGLLLIGLGSSFFAALDPRFLDQFDATEQGAGFGLVRTFYTVIGSAGSVGVGLLADLFGWGPSFLVLAGLFSITFLALVTNWAFDLGY
ncbi:major facilitator superfamily transport protein [Natrialba magadii ATCC 43099]|uniref:Major facilitator superfamily protein n=1 Tax=Natrialba magadii (strain ATCC 43099 / DSM 3394 / CCM 3739 / CIP 104546 / IAM 13178 / JCM 8861 / NBRC 102185 / NCIMB 2190 / MS3) TaxID=547559 RepID=D3SWB3_NATMM|nr:MFS transporter [Natrialba magadii]ADD03705.1 major facilitator superfamily transport protein [Natrialba magadii ATCC 43099]ELY34469.1 major facilitator superfamily protein [Natrialba magadii ATCC 43099]